MSLHHIGRNASSGGNRAENMNTLAFLSLFNIYGCLGILYIKVTICREVSTAMNLSLNNFHLDKVPSKVGYDLISGFASTCCWMMSQGYSTGLDIGAMGAKPPWMNMSKDVSIGSYAGSSS